MTQAPSINSHLRELFSLEGRVCLVTGGGSGIGGRIAQSLARAGAKAVLAGRRREALEKTAQDIRARNGEAECVPANLEDVADIQRLAQESPKFFGSPDILVNAAGVNFRRPPQDITPESWGKTLDLNLRAPFFLARELFPPDSPDAAQRRGAIINVGSLQSFRCGLGDAAYGASKGGVAQLTRVMAKIFAPMTVNALIPGFFQTDMTQTVFSDSALRDKLAESTLLGRNGELADFDGATVFLASPSAAYITGNCLPVDGGFLAK